MGIVFDMEGDWKLIIEDYEYPEYSGYGYCGSHVLTPEICDFSCNHLKKDEKILKIVNDSDEHYYHHPSGVKLSEVRNIISKLSVYFENRDIDIFDSYLITHGKCFENGDRETSKNYSETVRVQEDRDCPVCGKKLKGFQCLEFDDTVIHSDCSKKLANIISKLLKNQETVKSLL